MNTDGLKFDPGTEKQQRDLAAVIDILGPIAHLLIDNGKRDPHAVGVGLMRVALGILEQQFNRPSLMLWLQQIGTEYSRPAAKTLN